MLPESRPVFCYTSRMSSTIMHCYTREPMMNRCSRRARSETHSFNTVCHLANFERHSNKKRGRNTIENSLAASSPGSLGILSGPVTSTPRAVNRVVSGLRPELIERVQSKQPQAPAQMLIPQPHRHHVVEHDRPYFHLQGHGGWLNDPNGPLYDPNTGRYHLFFQHLPQGCVWDWKLVWGHAVSTDLVHWQRLPHAIEPTPGGLDGDGCFSGCATIDRDGRPCILYTGVRLKANPACGPLPPPECDLGLPFIESQCVAYADSERDPNLIQWAKEDIPFLPLPPPSRNLGGWRDPFLIGRPKDDSKPWVMLLGSGVKNKGGSVLVYKSMNLTHGWELDGELCTGNGGETGIVWECPLLAKLDVHPPPGVKRLTSSHQAKADVYNGTAAQVNGVDGNGTSSNGNHDATPFQSAASSAAANIAKAEKHRYFFSVSPDACTNPTLYWLGDANADGSRFNVDEAYGPYKLDLGDILYAPNVLQDHKGRTILWGWLQERRKVGSYDYAGCLSIPRLLWLDPDAPGRPHLVQQPIPEISNLRRLGASWSLDADLNSSSNGAADGSNGDSAANGTSAAGKVQGSSRGGAGMVLGGGQSLPIPQLEGPFLELELELARGGEGVTDGVPASSSGLVLRAWASGLEGSAVLLYNWESGTLEMVFEAIDPETHEFTFSSPDVRRVGGKLHRPPAPGESLKLQIFVDYSLVEVFTSNGEVLATRVNRGVGPVGAGCGVELVSVGGDTLVQQVAAHEMDSIWDLAPGSVELQSVDSLNSQYGTKLGGATMSQVIEMLQEVTAVTA